jgi:hypothetical protein
LALHRHRVCGWVAALAGEGCESCYYNRYNIVVGIPAMDTLASRTSHVDCRSEDIMRRVRRRRIATSSSSYSYQQAGGCPAVGCLHAWCMVPSASQCPAPSFRHTEASHRIELNPAGFRASTSATQNRAGCSAAAGGCQLPSRNLPIGRPPQRALGDPLTDLGDPPRWPPGSAGDNSAAQKASRWAIGAAPQLRAATATLATTHDGAWRGARWRARWRAGARARAWARAWARKSHTKLFGNLSNQNENPKTKTSCGPRKIVQVLSKNILSVLISHSHWPPPSPHRQKSMRAEFSCTQYVEWAYTAVASYCIMALYRIILYLHTTVWLLYHSRNGMV